jgi:hypothetical protein
MRPQKGTRLRGDDFVNRFTSLQSARPRTDNPREQAVSLQYHCLTAFHGQRYRTGMVATSNLTAGAPNHSFPDKDNRSRLAAGGAPRQGRLEHQSCRRKETKDEQIAVDHGDGAGIDSQDGRADYQRYDRQTNNGPG